MPTNIMTDERIAPNVEALEEPTLVVPRYFGPNWFASVMGTGIVANAGSSLPFDVPGLKVFCVAVWLLAAGLLVVLVAATALHWLRSPGIARSYGHDAQMSNFYGAPPMAMLTVGAGALLAAHSLLGLRVAVDLDWVLWSVGTVTGLITAVLIPFRLFTSVEVKPDAAFGGWLMPIVPPMVSATTGALLIPHIASLQGRATMLYGCYAMFGVSLVCTFVIVTLIWSRFVRVGTPNTEVPTLWIVLGPLGQSITAVGLLGAEAHLAVSSQLAAGMGVFAILYGVPVWGFAMLWAVLAAAITWRAFRDKMPFALTWWSFTFPVGVTVTGTIRLATQTGLPVFRWASGLGYVILLGAWFTVLVRTSIGARRGELLKHPGVASATSTTMREFVVRSLD